MFKKIVKIFISFVLGILGLGVSLSLIFVLIVGLRPEWIIKKPLVEIFLNKYISGDLKKFELKSKSFFEKRLALSFGSRPVCLKQETLSEPTQVCAKNLDFAILLNLKRLGDPVSALESLKLGGGEIYINVSEKKTEKPERNDFQSPHLTEWIQKIQKSKIQVAIDKITIREEKNTVEAKVAFEGMPVQGQSKDEFWKYKIAVSIRHPKMGSFNFYTDGALSATSVEGKLNGDAAGIIESVSGVRLGQPHIAKCGYNMNVSDGKDRLQGGIRCDLNAQELRARGQFYFDSELRQISNFKAWNRRCQVTARVDHFKDFARHLEHLGVSVPAPLNSLDGKISADLSCGVKNILNITTRLQSPNQVLNTTAEVIATQTKDEINIFGKLNLDEVKVVAPPISPPKIPSLVPSQAYGSRKMRAPASDIEKIKYKFLIKTPRKPLLIVSNFAKEPIPFVLDVVLTNTERGANIKGKVSAKKVALELFRRDAVLENLDLSFPENKISGEISVHYIDYTVFILINGTQAKPEIQLKSKPELPQDQVMSVLLFGEPVEELDPAQAESVEAVQAALADRSLRLLSLYFLASTPIESISYNPMTESFSAKVKLRDGTSLTLGSDFNDRLGVGIRQKLGGGWSIYTGVEAEQDQQNQTFTALLEWINRY